MESIVSFGTLAELLACKVFGRVITLTHMRSFSLLIHLMIHELINQNKYLVRLYIILFLCDLFKKV